MKLALKAQSKCRSTWADIAEIKNPRQVAFVKQANMGHNVQVNNGTSPVALPTRAEQMESEQIKLLEADHGQRLDTRTAGATGRTDQDLEAVGAVNRTKDGVR